MVFGIKATPKRNLNLVWKHVAPESLRLETLRVLVIGGTGGIGQGISRFLHERGAEVTVVGRTFRDQNIGGIRFVAANLELMTEAEKVGKELAQQPFDIVVVTAGIIASTTREETVEGIERDLAVSYLNRLVILRQLLPKLEKTQARIVAQPRVFIMGYPGVGAMGDPEDLNCEKSYGAMRAHMNTVAGNEALVFDCAKRYPHVSSFGLNPGSVSYTHLDVYKRQQEDCSEIIW